MGALLLQRVQGSSVHAQHVVYTWLAGSCGAGAQVESETGHCREHGERTSIDTGRQCMCLHVELMAQKRGDKEG